MEQTKHRFENYWKAYSDNAEAIKSAKRVWSQATLSRGIVLEAVRLLVSILSSDADSRLEETNGAVVCLQTPILWRDLRVEVVGFKNTDPQAECLSELFDRSREALCLCVLPSAGINVGDSAPQEMPWISVGCMYFYPEDIDALGRGACTLEELIEYKFYRVHALEKPAHEAQYDERLLTDFRSTLRGQPTALADVKELLRSQPDDPRRWAVHPIADRLFRALESGRSCLVIGPSSSGKTVLAFETADICTRNGMRARYLNLGSTPGAIPICLLDSISKPAGKDSIIFLDDLQSNPQAAKYFGNIINLARRASVVIAPRLVGISWPDFADVAAQFIEDALPVYVRAKDVRQGIISAYSSSGQLRGEQGTIEILKDDLQLLRIYLEVQEDFKNRAPTLMEVAAAYWSRKTRGAQAQSETLTRVALTVTALGRYDVLVTQAFVEQEAQVSNEVIEYLRRTGLLRLTRGFLTVGHRSLAALICDWLASVGGWNSMMPISGPSSPFEVTQDFLRASPPSAAFETLRALQARAGFKQTDKLNSRTAALVSTWKAFNALLERIEHQQAMDPQWGGILSSIMFVVQSLAEVGRTKEASSSIRFLRSKYRVEPSGRLWIEIATLKTIKDFEQIAEAMQEFDGAFCDTPLPPGWLSAGEIDIDKFHRTWLSGVVLCTEAAFREIPDAELSRLADAVGREQMPSGAFYPERAVWSTARVCLGLAACGRSIHTDNVLKKAINWLLTSTERGGACDAGIWRSGTGRWNTDLEVTSMAVLACLVSGIQADDERLRSATRFLTSQRNHWATPGSELDGALAAQVCLEAGVAWDEIAGQVYKLSEWAQGEAFWNTATLTSTESLEQSCRVAQTASHLISIGWSALRADLPVLLHALEMPERPVTVAIATEGTAQAGFLVGADSTRGPALREPEEIVLLASVEKMNSLKVEDLSVVNNYCRFDPKTRHQLKDWRLRICHNFTSKTCAHENFLIWAAPGSGKSFFITEIAASLAPDVTYIELNLAKQSQEEFSKGLEQTAQSRAPVLCMVDEVDARKDDLWPYEILFSHLDRNLSVDKTCVFVLIGSSRAGKNGMIQEMLRRSKGTDLLDRIPVDRRFEIPPMCLEDRGVVFVSNVREAARLRRQTVTQIERFALYYVLSAAELTSPRQLRDLAYSAVGRLSSTDDRLHYDNLFPTGDRRNQQFWGRHQEAADRLSDLYVGI